MVGIMKRLDRRELRLRHSGNFCRAHIRRFRRAVPEEGARIGRALRKCNCEVSQLRGSSVVHVARMRVPERKHVNDALSIT